MVRKWMKDMSVSDGKMDNSKAQHIFREKYKNKEYNDIAQKGIFVVALGKSLALEYIGEITVKS